MTKVLPLLLNARLSAQNAVHPDDVIVVKRSLQRLGYYEPWDGQLNSFTDHALFDGIKSFQKDHGLNVDGYLNPDGETASTISKLLFSNAPDVANQAAAQYPRRPPNQDPNKERLAEECDRMHDQDMVECDTVTKLHGPVAGTVCRGTAMMRYAACLRGTPIFDFPPLFRGPRDD